MPQWRVRDVMTTEMVTARDEVMQRVLRYTLMIEPGTVQAIRSGALR